MHRLNFFLMMFVLSRLVTPTAELRGQDLNGSSSWNGFVKKDFEIAGRSAYVVRPEKPAPGNPWVWRARFPNFHVEADLLLLQQGFHVGYVDVAALFGSPRAIAIGDQFYAHVIEEFGLSKQPALEGVSRGGLFVYNWAVANLDKVACIYCDTPVCDIKSWPGGKGKGIGSEKTWQQCLDVYELNAQQALEFDGNPIDHAEKIAQAKIPILHIVSENDRVVPPTENTYQLKRRLEQYGGALRVISVASGTEKSNGHHFDHPAAHEVAEFIARESTEDRLDLIRNAERIVFLGDSITFAGQYVALFDAWLQSHAGKKTPEVIDVGLPSETVSGLSEQGHAGGRFPRPVYMNDLLESLS